MRRWLIALTLVLALVGAGCSSDNKKDTAKSDKTSSKADDSKDDKGDSKDDKGGDGGGDAAGFCGTFKGYEDEMADFNPAASTDPEDLLEQIEVAKKTLEKFADAAPDEIRDDVKLVLGVTLKLMEALADADGNFMEIDPSVMASASEAEFTAASERVAKYFAEECGIGVTAP